MQCANVWEWQSNEDLQRKGDKTPTSQLQAGLDQSGYIFILTALARVDTEILLRATHSVPSA